jgi:hypothetical protein
MRTTGNGRPVLAAAAITVIVGGYATVTAQAATCKDELDRFERRLHSSTLAATDPGAFQTLVRQAEEAAELRDEEQCLEAVGALNEAVPEDPSTQPIRATPAATRNEAASTNPSRPAPPVLMIAGDDETADEPGEPAGEQETASVSSSGDEDENTLDN